MDKMVEFSRDLEDTLSVDCQSLDNIELSSVFLLPEHNLKTITFNIRSIEHNFSAFLVTLHRCKFEVDLIVLTECWLCENIIIP